MGQTNSYWKERQLPYKPGQTAPYKISRSKIELFMQCPRCFWLDVRLKIKRPNGPPFRINSLIDELLKKEFDGYRQKQAPHPWMTDNQIKAVPMQHSKLNDWRENFVGVFTLHEPTNLHIFGAIDDVWVNDGGEIFVVDYKATAKPTDVNIDADWQMSYKRQLEVYQWLLRQNGFSVNDTGYFVYTNGRVDPDGFYDRLEFKTKIIAYNGSDAWVEPALLNLKNCMDSDMPPVGQAAMGGDCDYCTYARQRTQLTLQAVTREKKSLAAE